MTANLNKFAGTYLNYREEVRSQVIALGGYVGPEWFETQASRLIAAYDLGEPVDFIADTLAAFGTAAMSRSEFGPVIVRPIKTPRQLAKRVVRVG